MDAAQVHLVDGGLARFGGIGLGFRQGLFQVDGEDWYRVALVSEPSLRRGGGRGRGRGAR